MYSGLGDHLKSSVIGYYIPNGNQLNNLRDNDKWSLLSPIFQFGECQSLVVRLYLCSCMALEIFYWRYCTEYKYTIEKLLE